jgi:hypothetical protein
MVPSFVRTIGHNQSINSTATLSGPLRWTTHDSTHDSISLHTNVARRKTNSTIRCLLCSLEERARLIQLDSPKYSGVIAQRMIVERLLAQGGIRLAGILNYIFAPKDDQDRQGLFIMNIDD